MSTHIQDAIATLEQELEGIDQRRGELVRAIDALRPLAGDDASFRRSKATKAKKRTNERTNERATRAPSRARRSLPDVTGDAILAALKTKSPQAPSALAKVLKLARPALTKQMKPLLKRGAVVATGTTRSRQFSLPGRAKEAP